MKGFEFPENETFCAAGWVKVSECEWLIKNPPPLWRRVVWILFLGLCFNPYQRALRIRNLEIKALDDPEFDCEVAEALAFDPLAEKRTRAENSEKPLTVMEAVKPPMSRLSV